LEATIGVIGGTGLYRMEGLSQVEFIEPCTPFGKPSDAIAVGSLDGVPVAFLPRHGRGHRLNPTRIPVRANIYALKSLGVQRVISVSAVGSLKEEYAPLDLVLPDQLIDRTSQRTSTFFDEELVAHISLADPFCHATSKVLQGSAEGLGTNVHFGGTLVVMEGPAFSTRAESFMYQSWGADVIGMTTLPEAKLAREAEMCYATMAWVTDYDCWHQTEEAVTAELILQNLLINVATSKELLKDVIPKLEEPPHCSCPSALEDAIVTPSDQIPDDIKQRLAPILDRYLKQRL
jgi:5'-methylthioadenosine phosphorylase